MVEKWAAFSNVLHRIIKNKTFSSFASSLGDLTFIGRGVGYFCLGRDSWVCLSEKKQLRGLSPWQLPSSLRRASETRWGTEWRPPWRWHHRGERLPEVGTGGQLGGWEEPWQCRRSWRPNCLRCHRSLSMWFLVEPAHSSCGLQWSPLQRKERSRICRARLQSQHAHSLVLLRPNHLALPLLRTGILLISRDSVKMKSKLQEWSCYQCLA